MTKIRIAIDTSYMDRRPGKGTAIVIRHTIEELLRYRNQFDVTLVHKESVPEDPLYKEFHEIIIPKIRLPKFSGFFSELWFFLTTKEHFDIYYFSYSRLYPTFWLAPAKHIVFAAMDGGPQTSGYKGAAKGSHSWWISLFFPKIDAFVALTEFGKRGICETYNIAPARVHVVPNGIDNRFTPSTNQEEIRQTVRTKYGLPARYLLCVSRFDPHKNIIRLLDAYHELVQQGDCSVPLVFVGGRHIPEYFTKIEERMKTLGIENKIIIAPFIEDADLPIVYGCAEAMVFPSLYEGFGLPVIEAMACGTPVVISNIDALTEVAGGYAYIVDPHDAHAIAEGIRHALTDPSRAERVRQAALWVSRFTWKEHGRALIEVFHSVAHT